MLPAEVEKSGTRTTRREAQVAEGTGQAFSPTIVASSDPDEHARLLAEVVAQRDAEKATRDVRYAVAYAASVAEAEARVARWEAEAPARYAAYMAAEQQAEWEAEEYRLAHPSWRERLLRLVERLLG